MWIAGMPRNFSVGSGTEHDAALRVKLTFDAGDIVAEPIRPHMFLRDRIAVTENAKLSRFRHDKSKHTSWNEAPNGRARAYAPQAAR